MLLLFSKFLVDVLHCFVAKKGKRRGDQQRTKERAGGGVASIWNETLTLVQLVLPARTSRSVQLIKHVIANRTRMSQTLESTLQEARVSDNARAQRRRIRGGRITREGMVSGRLVEEGSFVLAKLGGDFVGLCTGGNEKEGLDWRRGGRVQQRGNEGTCMMLTCLGPCICSSSSSTGISSSMGSTLRG